MSVLSYLDRILTELRQFLELGTVTTITVGAGFIAAIINAFIGAVILLIVLRLITRAA